MIITVVDDTHFVSGFELKYVRVWKATKSGPWDLALRFRAHEHWVLSVAALPGGTHFVSIASDKTAKLWTLDGTLVRTFDVGWVHCVASRRSTRSALWSASAAAARSGRSLGRVSRAVMVRR